MTAPRISSRYLEVPQQREGSSGCRIQFVLVMLVTLLLETLLLFATFADMLPILYATLLHIGIVLLLLFWQQKIFRCPEMGNRIVYLLLVATAAFGPLGVLGTLFTILMHAVYQRFSTDFNDWYSGLFPEEPPDEVSELAEFLEAHSRFPGANVPDSFRDILANGTQQQKRDAVVLMAKRFQPSFAPAMRSALVDSDSSIRILAASLITSIEKDFQDRTMRADRAVAESPDSIDKLLRQARLYDDYAFTGLLEQDREETNRERARQAYEKVLRLQPDNREAALSLGRLLVRSGELEQALDRLQQTPQYRDGEPQLMLWYAECLYRLGRFQELRELLREHGNTFVDGPGKRRPRIADAVQIWMGRGAPTG